MLKVSDLHVFHGPIEAVHGISLNVEQGQCVALLGPNGAGKTSTLSAISGIARCEGSIAFLGQDFAKLSIEERQKAGVALAPEGRRIFSNLTVLENLLIGAAGRKDSVAVKKDINYWFESFPVLGERREQLAGTLSGGEQQMLTIARALMSHPKILLLDEPSLGLAPLICRQIFKLIETLKSDGMTILLVEQNVHDAIGLADYVYLMNSGRVTKEGNRTLFNNNTMMAALTGIH